MEQYEEYIEDEDFNELESYEEYDSNTSKTTDNDQLVSIFSLISTWFIRIGIVIAIILLIVFFITGKVMTAFFYVIGLVVAFLFGYGFMYLLDHFVSTD